jgi:hypothetical protein
MERGEKNSAIVPASHPLSHAEIWKRVLRVVLIEKASGRSGA